MENTNSQQTGSPRKLGELLPPTLASTGNSRRPSSAITTTTGAARLNAVTRLDGTSDMPSGVTRMPNGPGRWVKAQTGPLQLPEETTLTLTNSLLSAIVHLGTSRFGTDGQYEGGAPRFGIDPNHRITPPEIHQNLRAVVASLAKAQPRDVVPIIATLKARTRGRAEGEGEARFNANVLAQDLCEYPLDVVQAACNAWIDTPEGKWFPAWADLKALCDRRMKGRLALQKALNWMLEGGQ